MKLSEMVDKILEDTAASSGLARSEMDDTILTAARSLETDVAVLTESNAALEKDAVEKITQLMKNQEALNHDNQRYKGLLEIERTKVQYLGKLAELNRRKVPLGHCNVSWETACLSALDLLDNKYSDESLRDAVKTAKDILCGAIPWSVEL